MTPVAQQDQKVLDGIKCFGKVGARSTFLIEDEFRKRNKNLESQKMEWKRVEEIVKVEFKEELEALKSKHQICDSNQDDDDTDGNAK